MEARPGDEAHTEEREEDEHEGAGGGVGKRVVSDLISYWELKKKGVSFGVLPPALLGAAQVESPSIHRGVMMTLAKKKKSGSLRNLRNLPDSNGHLPESE